MDVQKYLEKYDELPYIGNHSLTHSFISSITDILTYLDFTDDEDTFDVTNIDRFCKTVQQVLFSSLTYSLTYSLTHSLTHWLPP